MILGLPDTANGFRISDRKEVGKQETLKTIKSLKTTKEELKKEVTEKKGLDCTKLSPT